MRPTSVSSSAVAGQPDEAPQSQQDQQSHIPGSVGTRTPSEIRHLVRLQSFSEYESDAESQDNPAAQTQTAGKSPRIIISVTNASERPKKTTSAEFTDISEEQEDGAPVRDRDAVQSKLNGMFTSQRPKRNGNAFNAFSSSSSIHQTRKALGRSQSSVLSASSAERRRLSTSSAERRRINNIGAKTRWDMFMGRDVSKKAQLMLGNASKFKYMSEAQRVVKVGKRYRVCNIFWMPLLPNAPFRNILDILVMVCLFYTMIFVPVEFAFVKKPSHSSFVIGVIIDFIFAIDIVTTFLTGYIENDADGSVTTSFRLIAKRYMRSWFLIDVVATIPFYLFLPQSAGRVTSTLKLYRLVRLLKMLRVMQVLKGTKFQTLTFYLTYNPKIHPGLVRMLQAIFFLFLAGHFSACMWYYLGTVYDQGEEFTWIRQTNDRYFCRDAWDDVAKDCLEPGNYFHQESTVHRYLVSLYWSYTVMTAVGFGDIVPHTPYERFFAMFLMLGGVLFFSYWMASLTSMVTTRDIRQGEIRRKMATLFLFMDQMQLPARLRVRLVDRMREAWSQPHIDNDYPTLMAEFPRAERLSISLHIYREMLSRSDFLRQAKQTNQNFVAELLAELQLETFAPGEYLVRRGDLVDRWFIVDIGSAVAISHLDANAKYMTFHPGATFGEIGLLTDSFETRWQIDIRADADKNCRVFSCAGRTFMRILADHPKIRHRLIEIAEERLRMMLWAMRTKGPSAKAKRLAKQGNKRGAETFANLSLKGEVSAVAMSASPSGDTNTTDTTRAGRLSRKGPKLDDVERLLVSLLKDNRNLRKSLRSIQDKLNCSVDNDLQSPSPSPLKEKRQIKVENPSSSSQAAGVDNAAVLRELQEIRALLLNQSKHSTRPHNLGDPG